MAAVALATMSKSDTWAASETMYNGSYSFGNSMSLTRAGSLSNMISYETHGNGLTESATELSSLKCSKCLCLHTECICVIEYDTHQLGPAYAPNPSDCDLPREYETHVQVFMRVPEMVPVEKTFYKKKAIYEEQTVSVSKPKIIRETVEHFEIVPVVKMVPKTRTEIVYIEKREQIEVTEMEFVVVEEQVCRIESRPRVITEDIEETIMVPVVKEVPVTRMVEEWTGRYCESEVEKFRSPGDFNLIREDSLIRNKSSKNGSKSSSRGPDSSGDSPSHTKRRSNGFSPNEKI